jgi:hypothetical protein
MPPPIQLRIGKRRCKKKIIYPLETKDLITRPIITAAAIIITIRGIHVLNPPIPSAVSLIYVAALVPITPVVPANCVSTTTPIPKSIPTNTKLSIAGYNSPKPIPFLDLNIPNILSILRHLRQFLINKKRFI